MTKNYQRITRALDRLRVNLISVLTVGGARAVLAIYDARRPAELRKESKSCALPAEETQTGTPERIQHLFIPQFSHKKRFTFLGLVFLGRKSNHKKS